MSKQPQKVKAVLTSYGNLTWINKIDKYVTSFAAVNDSGKIVYCYVIPVEDVKIEIEKHEARNTVAYYRYVGDGNYEACTLEEIKKLVADYE